MSAFRCKNCGRIHAAEHAGENELPHACAVCNAGVSFHPRTGLKQLDPDNWEVLADCDDERLAELGIDLASVVRHSEKTGLVPGKTPPLATGRHIHATTSESVTSKDKE